MTVCIARTADNLLMHADMRERMRIRIDSLGCTDSSRARGCFRVRQSEVVHVSPTPVQTGALDGSVALAVWVLCVALGTDACLVRPRFQHSLTLLASWVSLSIFHHTSVICYK